MREKWILSPWPSSILGKIIGRDGDQTSNLLFSRPVHYWLTYGTWPYKLTHYQMTNFRLFQIQRLCRWQFTIWRKCYEQFLLVLQCFQKACFPGASKGVIVWEWINLYNNTIISSLLELWERRYPSLLLRLLTHYQTRNFRLVQTERVCRRQFQTWREWQKVILTGRKHCGRRRNCPLRAISPFPTVFSKGSFPLGV